MEFRILGPVEVAGAGKAIRLGSRRERAVLAALVIGRGDVVSADRLIDALWGDAPPRSAAKTLQNYVLKLRKALGAETIVTQAPGYRLALESADIDARRFERLIGTIGEARAAERPEAVTAPAREALALWRGMPLEELDGWEAARTEAGRLRELRRLVEEDLMDAEVACGRSAAAVPELEAMVAAEPLRERRWSMLMLALYRCGRQAEALRTYQRARTLLGDELGIEPGPELRALEQMIAGQDPALDCSRPAGDAARTDGEPDASSCPPYKGLAAFEAEDHAQFFGRDALVADLVARVERSSFVAVVGPSGSGKSSVVRAGVVATLRGGAGPGDATWSSVIVTPGARPLVELACALAPVLGMSTSEVLDALDADPGAIGSLVREGLDPGVRLVLVVDQLEELFTQARDANERRQFVAALVRAATHPGRRVIVVTAVRADFYGHCSAFPDLARVLDDGSTLLCAMAADDIRAAVECPAAAAGLRVEPGLTELIVRDLGDEPGGLPLLSHALLETWKRRTQRTLTVAAYRDAGGASGAIAQTAESVYGRLDPSAQLEARRIFLRLTDLGDGTEDTSRRVGREEVEDAGDGAAPTGVLQVLAEARLVTLDAETVQVAHEALIREWPRLRAWLDEDREGRRIHRRLTNAARDWEALGHEPAELYRGPRLATAAEWLARDGHEDEVNALEAAFLRASTAAEATERAAQDQRVQARERSNRRLRLLLGATALALVVALVAGAVAFAQRDRADDEAAGARAASNAATAGRLVAESKSLQGENRYLGTLLALEANRLSGAPQARGAVFGAVLEEPRRVLTIPTRTSSSVVPLPDETALVRSGGTVEHWDLGRGRLLARFGGPPVTALATGPDGVVAVGRDDGTIAIIDASGRPAGAAIPTTAGIGGAQRLPLPVSRGGLGLGPSAVAFSPDGRSLAASFGLFGDPRRADGSDWIRVYDVGSGRDLGARFGGQTGTVTAVAFSPDGRRLLAGANDGTVVLHDATSGAALGGPMRFGGGVWSASFDPVRNRIAVASLAEGATVVDLDQGSRTQVGSGTESDASWSRDGSKLAVGGNAPTQVYDAATLTPVGAPIDAQTGTATPRFTAAGRLLVGGRGGPATLWDLGGQSVLTRPLPHAPTYVFPMAGGKVVAVPDLKDSVTLYDERTLRPLGPALSPGAGPETPLVFPTTFAASYYRGDRIAVLNRAGDMQLYRVPSGEPIDAPFHLGFASLYAVFSRDLRQIAVGGRQGEIALVDLRRRQVRRLRSPLNNYIDGLAFSAHDELVAADSGHAVLFRRLHRSDPVVRDLSRFTQGADGPAGLDLSPDGHTIAIAGRGAISFVDIATERRVGPVVRVSPGQVTWVAYSHDGRTVVTADNANNTRLVDVQQRQVIGPVLPTAPLTGPVFSSDSKILGTADPVAGGELLSVDPAVWRREACRLAGRNLTASEWATYLPGQGPRHRTCAQYS